jgi:hypothetical protein
MNLLDRFRIWRAHRDVAREARQEQRCAAGRHHWKSFGPDRVLCHDPGCGRWYGQ